jgi:hypothetical protein
MGWFDLFTRPPTPDRFADLLRAYLLRVRPGVQIDYDPGKFRFKINGTQRLALHNAYRDYTQAGRGERRHVLATYARLLDPHEAPATFDAARARLMPVVRPRAMLGLLQLKDPRGSLPLACDVLAEDALRALALDGEGTMQMVTPAHLEQWGESFETAFAVALQNLRDRSPDQFTRAAGVTVGQWHDSYDSSRLFLGDQAHRALGHGAAVAMIPVRDTLLLAPANAPAAQLAMVALARKALATGARPGSMRMFGYAHGVPVPYEPTDPGVAASLRALQIEQLHADYDEQKGRLDAVNARARKDVFVATCMAVRKDEELLSVCTWTEGVRTLLPRTDLVILMRPDAGGQHAMRRVRWETLSKGAAHLMKEQPGYPVRYAVSRFPEALFTVVADEW